MARDLLRVPEGPPVVRAILGPTNTGKTHRALEALMGHATGMIGLPLRLLAREVYDRLTERVGEAAVALMTGEERRIPARPRFWVCTVEAMPLDRGVDFLAVDEVQLAADPGRGHVFTDRILHARGRRETLFLGSDVIAPLLRRMLPDVAIETHPRLSRLTWGGERRLGALPPRSAVVAFSAERVYQLAEAVRRKSGGAAVVLGALSPRTRNAQVAMFQAGEVATLVATDAIGMGLNLDLAHVAFAEVHKFDGERVRRLGPAELGQIAGRAGRFRQDGSFGTTDSGPAWDEATVEAVRTQSFPPLRRLWWRARDLDLSGIEPLLASLRRAPPHPFLERPRPDDDERALEVMGHLPEVRARARDPEGVGLLWEVCRIPDYRKLGRDTHARRLLPIYLRLADRGVLGTGWVARQVEALDRVDGDLDALTGRLAAVRTWAYVAHRGDWTDDPRGLQALTAAVEERLSDALHLALTERFVDRRARVEGAPDGGEVRADEVRLGGRPVGRLAGLVFVPAVAGAGVPRALRASLAAEVDRRAGRLAEAEHAAFTVDDEGVVHWGGAPVGRLVAGPTLREPSVRVARNELLGPGAQARVHRRLAAWARDHVAEVLAPLRREEVPRGPARGLLYALEAGLGTVPAAEVADLVAKLDVRERRALARVGVRFGVGWTWSQPMLDHGPARAVLAAVHFGLRAPLPPLVGPRSTDAPERWYTAAGSVAVGPRALRVDVGEALGAALRQLARHGPFVAPALFHAHVPLEDRVAVMAAFGYEAMGDRWIRSARGRRPSDAERARRRASG